jgi:hypothetical protein
MNRLLTQPRWLPLLGSGLVAGALLGANTATGADLEKQLADARSLSFVAASWREAERARESFEQLLTSGHAPERIRQWRAMGMQLGGAASDIVVLREQEGQRRGRGFFALRQAPALPLLLQAPHQYHDTGTGALAIKLFLQSDTLAAVWNTAHRYLTDDSDLAHVEHSYLHAMSLAFSRHYPNGRVLQLHGFGPRDSRRGVQAIVSDGTRSPSRAARLFATCLASRLQIDARLYPHGIGELGATTNTVGAALRRQGFSGFLHLEMDRELRRRLIAEPQARKLLMACVEESYR